MRLIIETSAGTFAAFLNSNGEIVVYEGDEEASVAVLDPLVKRRSVLDTSTDGVAKAVRTWLENNYERLVVESVVVHLVPGCP